MTILHRTENYRASKIMLERARAHPKIEFLSNVTVQEVSDVEKQEVTRLHLRDQRSGKEFDFPTSAMFLGIGHIPNAKMFEGQLDLDRDGYILTDGYVFTRRPGTPERVPGVFACGDVQDRRYRQAVTAAGTGCMAALEAEKFLEELGR